jgi:hypothetical protein
MPPGKAPVGGMSELSDKRGERDGLTETNRGAAPGKAPVGGMSEPSGVNEASATFQRGERDVLKYVHHEPGVNPPEGTRRWNVGTVRSTKRARRFNEASAMF